MTMPKFEPVAEVLWYDPALRHTPEPAGKIIDGSMSFIESAAIGTQLYTADQLTEAYEAGKREASEDIEQAAFEKWLYDKCQPGDLESVQRQWLESYEYAELVGKMEQAAQINHLQMALADTEALEAETSARCLKQDAQIEMMREALCNIIAHDKYVMFQRCPDCDHECAETCKDMPISDYGKIATKALGTTTPDQALEQFAAKVREERGGLKPPNGYTAEELEKDNPFNQWMRED